jgi:hypothetical protein
VVARKASLKVEAITWSPDGRSFSPTYPQALEISPGQSNYLEITGTGIAPLDPAGVAISGTGVRPDPDTFVRGVSPDGTSYVIIRVAARPDAPPGPRSLYLTWGDERAVLTGAIEVAAP